MKLRLSIGNEYGQTIAFYDTQVDTDKLVSGYQMQTRMPSGVMIQGARAHLDILPDDAPLDNPLFRGDAAPELGP